MKKLLTLLLTLTILAGTLGACKPADNNPATSSSDPGASQTETSEEVSNVPDPKDPLMLSAEQENRIKEDWVSSWNTEWIEKEPKVWIEYYGTYNGCVALILSDNYNNYPTIVWEENIGEVVFHFSDGNFIRVWDKGNFIYLSSAYEQGLLTQEDLKDIAYYYNGN